MRLGSLLTGVTAFTVLVCAGPRDASACSCFASGPSCQNAFQVDAVFAGRVVAITPVVNDATPVRNGEAPEPRAVRVEFADVETYRGPRVTSIVTASDGPACGYTFTSGERYVVYARRNAKGSGLETSICSRTRPLAEAGDDLRFFRTLTATPPPLARVSGTITHWEREFASGQPIQVGPVPDVLVTVRGSSTSFHGTTDARGHYEVLVPPGAYEINASPAAPFAALLHPQSITLPDPRACFVADFGVQFDGRIRGSVWGASGEPAVGAVVQLMAADDVGKSGNIQTLRTPSDAGGRFEFTDLSPGRYVVGVDLTRRMDGDPVFPRTFHPGTADGASATVVELDGGGQRELSAIVLPPPRARYELTGTILFENGIPVAGADVSLWDGGEQWRQVAVGVSTGSDGSFSFPVHDGLSYIARASYWDQAERRNVGTTLGPFAAGPGMRPLRIVLPPANGR